MLFQRWSKTLKQRWSDVEMLLGAEKETKTHNLASNLQYSLLIRSLLAFSILYQETKNKNAHGTTDLPDSSNI